MSHAASEWMPWYGDDFWRSTRVAELSNDEALLYAWAIWQNWESGSLPADPEAVLRMAPGRFARCFEPAWKAVSRFFEVGPDGRLRNDRVARELCDAAEKMAKCSKAGLASGAARRRKYLDRLALEQTLNGRSTDVGTERERNGNPDRDRTGRMTEPDQKNPEQNPPPVGVPGAPVGKREKTPEQVAKAAEAARHREAGKAAWQAAWAEHRPDGDPFEFAEKHSTVLRKMHAKHGTEKLRFKADALLSLMDPWVYANATPTLLATRWSQLGQPVPRRMTALEQTLQATANVASEIDAIEAAARAARNAR